MRPLADAALDRLRTELDAPDLTGTRYELISLLGRGGMGSVFRVRDRELGREVALKVLTLEDGGELADRLRAEARVLARLEHPGIVPVHDVGTLADGRAFYVMKLVKGARLDTLRAASARPRELRPLLRIFERLCEAVAFAHERGVLHRDLKPENVMVGDFGEVLLMDWGVARLREEAARGPTEQASATPGATAHGTILGTPGYMAPEQARGQQQRIDARSDVYGLGAILYFLLTGHAPGRGPADPEAETRTAAAAGGHPSLTLPPRQLGSDVARPLGAICTKALAEQQERRYASARELGADVGAFLEGRPVTAYRENWLERGARVARRHRALVALVATYVLFRVILILAAR